MIDKTPKTLLENALDLGGVEVAPGLDFAPKTSVQLTAVNLHKRGLNVFPIPRGYKQPYKLSPLFYARLHRCGRGCKAYHTVPYVLRDGRRTNATFETLFECQNIAVMMGRTSENLFAIDCDTEADFKGMGAELDRRGLSYWATKSAKGGHYFMRLAEGEVANNPGLEGWGQVEIWGNRHFVVLPPSIHPSGVLYEWHTQDPYRLPIDEKPPLVSIQALDWLGVERVTNGKKWEAAELHGLPEWTISLSRSNRQILAKAISGGIEEGQRNSELRSPVYDIAAMIKAELIDYEKGLDLLETAADGVDYPLKDILGMLKSALRKPGLELARKSGKAKLTEWEKALEFAKSYDWKGYGPTQHTDKAVFLACCERARLDPGRGGFRASAREIARLSNKTAKTCSLALRRLVKANLLIYASIDPSGANRFKFGEVYRDYYTNTLHCSDSVVATIHHKLTETPAEKDVFGRLGAVSWAVYNYLLESYESSYKAIAEGANLNRVSVARVLKRSKTSPSLDGVLIRFGLAIYTPAENSYKAELASNDKLERIAAVLGVLGKSEKRARLDVAQRELRANEKLAWYMGKDTRNYLNGRK